MDGKFRIVGSKESHEPILYCMGNLETQASVRALRAWDKVSLLHAKAWWLWFGVGVVGKRDAYNAVAAIELALKAK